MYYYTAAVGVACLSWLALLANVPLRQTTAYLSVTIVRSHGCGSKQLPQLSEGAVSCYAQYRCIWLCLRLQNTRDLLHQPLQIAINCCSDNVLLVCRPLPGRSYLVIEFDLQSLCFGQYESNGERVYTWLPQELSPSLGPLHIRQPLPHCVSLVRSPSKGRGSTAVQ